jgi:hypothetical protein
MDGSMCKKSLVRSKVAATEKPQTLFQEANLRLLSASSIKENRERKPGNRLTTLTQSKECW